MIIGIYVFLYQNLNFKNPVSIKMAFNLCISILEFKYGEIEIINPLINDLCISILEFKWRTKNIYSRRSRIYVFLYQNLNITALAGDAIELRKFMYFYIRI